MIDQAGRSKHCTGASQDGKGTFGLLSPRRTRILIEGSRELLSRLSHQVEQHYPVRIERRPTKALAMAKARDSVTGQPFYLGEILVTECTVAIGNTFGFGAVMGEDSRRAYELAIIDAAYRAKLPATMTWSEQLEEEEQRIERRHREQFAMALSTKVDFSTAEGFDDKR